jgi:hypothetical protein
MANEKQILRCARKLCATLIENLNPIAAWNFNRGKTHSSASFRISEWFRRLFGLLAGTIRMLDRAEANRIMARP